MSRRGWRLWPCRSCCRLHGDKRIELAAAGEAGCFAKAGIGRLDDDAVVNIEIDTGRPQRGEDGRSRFGLAQGGIEKDERSPRTEIDQIVPDLA